MRSFWVLRKFDEGMSPIIYSKQVNKSLAAQEVINEKKKRKMKESDFSTNDTKHQMTCKHTVCILGSNDNFISNERNTAAHCIRTNIGILSAFTFCKRLTALSSFSSHQISFILKCEWYCRQMSTLYSVPLFSIFFLVMSTSSLWNAVFRDVFEILDVSLSPSFWQLNFF